MFRLAFPYADADEESAEMAYLESRFDTDVANGGMTTRPRGRRTQGVLCLLYTSPSPRDS